VVHVCGQPLGGTSWWTGFEEPRIFLWQLPARAATGCELVDFLEPHSDARRPHCLGCGVPQTSAVSALQSFGPYGITAGNPQPFGNVQNITVSNGNDRSNRALRICKPRCGKQLDDKQITGRGDWNISNKDRFFFRFIYQNSNTAWEAAQYPAARCGSAGARPAVWLDYTHTWTTNFITQGRVSYGKGFFKFAGGQAFPNAPSKM